jgi:DNA repair protein RecO (recombination protein O)
VKSARVVHSNSALLLRRVEFGEADLIVTLFTRQLGRVAAIARGARKSQKRFGGALEPFFTLDVRLEERAQSELLVLTEAAISRARLGLLSHLSRLDAAGRALGWVRKASPPRTPEPRIFALLERFLERLNADDPALIAERELGELGLALLDEFGWGITFERCVSCGKACPEGKPGNVDARRGGLVCQSCGGGRIRLSGPQRTRLARAASGEASVLSLEDVQTALDLVERVFAAHAGFE